MSFLCSICYRVRVGSLNVGTVAGRGRGLGGYDGNEKGLSVVCVRDKMEGEQREIRKRDPVMSTELGLE